MADPGSPFRLRMARQSDIPQLAEIERASFTTPWSDTQLAAQLVKPEGRMLAAVGGEVVIAYVSWDVVLDEGQIANLAVRPDWRRRGVATALCAGLIEHARKEGLTRLTLEVQAAKTGARSLYLSLGFVETGRRPGYYQAEKDDAILLDFDLAE